MKKTYIFLAIALLAGFGACTKVAETDIPETPHRTYPDGLTFRASISSVTKASFLGDNSGQLVWDGDEDVAIIAVPVLDTRGYSYEHLHTYDISHAVSGIAVVEVDPSDPTMASLHTAKTLDDWTKDMTRVQFFAIYPANGDKPSMVNNEEMDDDRYALFFLKDIPAEQDGVNYQKAMILGAATPAYYIENGILSVEDGGEAVDPDFIGFLPGNSVFSFKVHNATSQNLDIKRIKISTVPIGDAHPHPEDVALSGTQAVFIDDQKARERHGVLDISDVVDCFPYNPTEDDNFVNLTLPSVVSLGPDETTENRFFASVSVSGMYKSPEVEAYLLFEAFDSEDQLIASCERPFPSNMDGKGDVDPGIEQGTRYNFTLHLEPDTSEYHFFVTSQPDGAYSGSENTVEGYVNSYRVQDGVASYVEWGYNGGVYADGACTQPIPQSEWETWLKSWSKTSPEAGDSPTASYKATVTVKANPNPWVVNTYDCRAEVRNALSGAEEKGSSSAYYNLSNATGAAAIENTANCYVLNGPGYYTFPCVLGNGIKGGLPNPGAWLATDSPWTQYTSDFIGNLVDYKNADIVSPYLHSSSSGVGTPTSAILLWEDCANLIDTPDNSLTLSGPDANGVYWVQFHVDASTIDQGNAVIAVKDNEGVIMWSWHIWVTDRKLDGTEDISVDGVGFSQVNLGWVETERLTSWSRQGNTAYVKITQEGSGKTAVVKIVQMGDEVTPLELDNAPRVYSANGYSPFYQYGRKDPVIPGIPSGTTAAGSDVQVWGTVTSLSKEIHGDEDNVPISYSIQHPGSLIFVPRDGGNDEYFYFSGNGLFNLWNTLASHSKKLPSVNDTQRKSVYDPTPVGYQAPQPYDTRRFLYISAQEDEETESVILVPPSTSDVAAFSSKGYYVSSGTGPYLYFPMSGARTAAGGGAIWAKFEDRDYSGVIPFYSMGVSNNQEDGNLGAEFHTFFTFQDVNFETFEIDFNGLKYVWMGNEHGNSYIAAGSAGFVRPVADRSTTLTPSTPVFGGGNGAGSYIDETFGR